MDVPGCGCGPEHAPEVVGTEERAAVCTYRGVYEVAGVIVVLGLAEEREQGLAHGVVTYLVLRCDGSIQVRYGGVHRGSVYIVLLIVVHHGFLTGEDVESVLAPCVGVADGVGGGQLQIVCVGGLESTGVASGVGSPVAAAFSECTLCRVVGLDDQTLYRFPLQVGDTVDAVLFLPLLVVLGGVEGVDVGVLGDFQVVLAVLIVERMPGEHQQTCVHRVVIVEGLHGHVVLVGVGQVDAGAYAEGLRQLVVGVDAGLELLEVDSVGYALVVLVGQGRVETSAVGAGLGVDLVLLEQAGLGEGVYPVGHGHVVHGHGIVVGGAGIIRVVAGVDSRYSLEVQKLGTCEDAEPVVVGQHRASELHTGGEAGLSGLAALGSHEDDTVGRAGSVDGGGGSVLEDGDGLDIVGVNGGHGVTGVGEVGLVAAHHGDTVHYPQGVIACIDGRDTADTDLRACTGLSGRCTHGYTGQFTCQHLVDRGHGSLAYHVTADCGDGSCRGFPAGCTVGDDHYVFEHLGFEFKLDADVGASVDRYGLGSESEEGDDQDAVLGNGEREVAEIICHSVDSRAALQLYCRSYDGLTCAGISNSTRYSEVLGIKRSPSHEQQAC